MTFKYRLTMDTAYETSEYADVLASIDGALVGTGGNDKVAHVHGDGNEGPNYDSGWQTVTINIGALSAGNHTLTLGGYNNQKTAWDESAQISFDDVQITNNTSQTENLAIDIEAIPLTISSALTDTDGSESLSITITGVPTGATLSAGTDNGGGSWTLTPAQLTGLTLTPALNDDSDFQLTVTATATDGSDTSIASDTIAVTVNSINDGPVATASLASSEQDQAISGQLTGSDVDNSAADLTGGGY